MKQCFLFLSCCLVVPYLPLLAQNTDTLLWQGLERTYDIYLPAGYSASGKYPLVVSLHPGLSNSANHAAAARWQEVGDTANFISVYPNAIKPSALSPGGIWNAYEQPSAVDEMDDVGFLNTMLNVLTAQYSIDTCRMYLSGFSSGAMMTYRMACDFTHRFAAIAPLSGGWAYGTDGFCDDGNCNGDPAGNCGWNMAYVNCQPDKRIPVIFMKGSLEQDNLPTCRGTTDSLNKIFWSNYLMCALPITDTVVVASKSVVRERYFDCADNTTFQFLTVLGNSHTWHQPATQMFWLFLRNQTACVCNVPATVVLNGNNMVCSNNGQVYTYSTNAVAGATYNWTITGGTIIAGQGSNEIQVIWNAGTEGVLQVSIAQ